MKIKTIALSILCALMLIMAVGCGNQETSNTGQTSFRGIVTDVQDKTITVQPYDNQPEASNEELMVNVDIDASKKPEHLEPGKSVYISYDGNITSGTPAKVDTVYEIKLIDVEGNLIDN